MVNSGPSILKQKDERNRICRYCGVFRPQSEITSVPTTQAQLTKWINILGPQFAENIKKTKSNSICLNHIVNRERGPDRLPKKMAIHPKFVFDMPKAKKPKTGKYDHRVCRYCGESRTQSDMTWIPKNPEDLEKWIEILGPEFAENIKKYKSNFICMTHIKNEVRRPCRLPNRVQNTSNGNEEDEEDQGVVKANADIPGVDEKNQTIEKDDPEITMPEPGELKVKKENAADIPKVDVAMEQDQTVERDDSEITISIVPESVELEVPVTKEFKPENQNLRSSVRSMDSVQQMKPILKPVSSRDLEIIVKPDPSGPVSIISGFSDSGAIEMETGDSSSSAAAYQIEEIFQCRVCGIDCTENLMVKTPTDPEEMKNWFNLLGDAYLHNIVLNSAPHFICLSHVPEMVKKVCQK